MDGNLDFNSITEDDIEVVGRTERVTPSFEPEIPDDEGSQAHSQDQNEPAGSSNNSESGNEEPEESNTSGGNDQAEGDQGSQEESLAPTITLESLTGGRIKTQEELEALIQASANKVEFANEQVRKINELVSKGVVDVEGALRLQAMNFDQMEDLEVVRMAFDLDNQDLSETDRQLLLEETYKLNEELYDERERQLGQIHLRKAAKEARERMKSYQAEQASAAPDYAAMQQAWNAEVDAVVPTIQEVKIQVTKDQAVNFKPTPEILAALSNAMKDPNWLMNTYGVKDANGNSKLDVARYGSDLLMLLPEARPMIFAELLNTGSAQGMRSVEATLKNPSAGKGEGPAASRFANEDEELIHAFTNATRVRN